MNKLWPTLVLRFIFMSYLIPFLTVVIDFDMFVIRNYTAKYSYISTVAPGLLQRTNNTLHIFELNQKKGTFTTNKGKRPIYVRGMYSLEEYWFGDNNLGYASPNPASCTIVMNQNNIRDLHTWQVTFIHEYLHCLGYKHVDNRKDLMYPHNTGHNWTEMWRWADKLKREIFYE